MITKCFVFKSTSTFKKSGPEGKNLYGFLKVDFVPLFLKVDFVPLFLKVDFVPLFLKVDKVGYKVIF